MTAVLAAALIVHPISPSVSSAATPLSATWTSALASSASILGKVFSVGKLLLGSGGSGLAMTLAGPILSSLFGRPTPPTIQDVLHELDGIKDDLTQMDQHLDAINQQVLVDEAVTEIGDCNIEASELEALRSTVYEINENYQSWITALQQAQTQDDLIDVKTAQDDFIDKALDGNAEVFNTPLANAIDGIHDSLVSDGGIIQTCGEAYLEDWRNANAVGTGLSAVGPDAAGAWVDDRPYYQDITQVVQFWETVEGHALFLLQQAVLMDIGNSWPADGVALTQDNAQSICDLARAVVPERHVLCTSMDSYGSTTVYGYWKKEWGAAGVPYSDDKVLLSIGSSVSGLGTDVPSTAWVRDPAASEIPWATSPQSWSATPGAVGFDEINGWLPAGGTQWQGLSSGYVRSHPSSAPAEYSARTPTICTAQDVQGWNQCGTAADIYTGSKLPPYAPLDVLTTMQSVTAPDGAQAFSTEGITQVWMPTETSTDNLAPWPTGPEGDSTTNVSPGLQFLPSYSTDGDGMETDSIGGTNTVYAYYNDTGLTTKCMVLSPDGVLCDPATVASWWVGQLESSYSVVSSDGWTGNWTGAASFAVTPSSNAVQPFTATGLNEGCGGESSWCGIGLSTITSLPSWIVDFTTADGTPHTSADTPAAVWPAYAVPDQQTSPDCWTIWGAPTRCGAAMDAWLAANVPNPNVQGPVAIAAPVVADGANTEAACQAPQWASTTDADGSPLVTGSTLTWTAELPSGASFSVETDASVGTIAPGSLVLAAGWRNVDTIDLTCSWTAWFADSSANRTVVSADPTPMALFGGNWVLERPGIDVALDVVRSSGQPTAPQLGSVSTVTVTNTGNVPLHDVVVTHEVPGGAPFAVTWPGAPGTLAPGEKATGNATIAPGATPAAATSSPASTPAVGQQVRPAVITVAEASGFTVHSTATGTAPSGIVVLDTDNRDVVLVVPPVQTSETSPTVTVTPTPATSTVVQTLPTGRDGSPVAPAAGSADRSLAYTGVAVAPVAWTGAMLLLAGAAILLGTRMLVTRRRPQSWN